MSNVYDADGLLPKRAFRTLTGRPYGKLLSLEGGGKDSPPAPDYVGAAAQTAAGNLEATRAAAAANRVNQVTPYGTLTYSKSPGTFNQAAYDAAMQQYQQAKAAAAAGSSSLSSSGGLRALVGLGGMSTAQPQLTPPNMADFYINDPDGGWTVTQELSPTEKAKLEASDTLALGLLGTAKKGLGYTDAALSTGGALDEAKLAQPGISGQSVQDAIMSRLAPQINRDRESLRTRLANQGLMEGSEAYKNAMLEQGQKENDLYTNAALQGIQTGLTARQQGIQEQYAAQDRPLNIVNALRTGTQVNLPQFQNVPQQATTQGADMLQAAMAQGNYDAQNNAASAAQTSGLMGSAATVAAAYFL